MIYLAVTSVVSCARASCHVHATRTFTQLTRAHTRPIVHAHARPLRARARPGALMHARARPHTLVHGIQDNHS